MVQEATTDAHGSADALLAEAAESLDGICAVVKGLVEEIGLDPSVRQRLCVVADSAVACRDRIDRAIDLLDGAS
jgi:hypothetical protein